MYSVEAQGARLGRRADINYWGAMTMSTEVLPKLAGASWVNMVLESGFGH